MSTGKKKSDFDYEFDGIVIKADSLQIQEELGATAKAPRLWHLNCHQKNRQPNF